MIIKSIFYRSLIEISIHIIFLLAYATVNLFIKLFKMHAYTSNYSLQMHLPSSVKSKLKCWPSISLKFIVVLAEYCDLHSLQ